MKKKKKDSLIIPFWGVIVLCVRVYCRALSTCECVHLQQLTLKSSPRIIQASCYCTWDPYKPTGVGHYYFFVPKVTEARRG